MNNQDFCFKEACRLGDSEEVLRMIHNYPDMNMNQLLFDVTPLGHACANGHIETAQILLDHGANIDAPYLKSTSQQIKFHSTFTPVFDACARGDMRTTLFLLKHGANEIPKNILWYACKAADAEVVTYISQHFPHLINYNYPNALILASSCGLNDIIDILLFYHVDVAVREGNCLCNSKSPISVAKDMNIFMKLVDYSLAQSSVATSWRMSLGKTVLMIAICGLQESLALRLLNHDEHTITLIKARDYCYWTAFMYACSVGLTAVVEKIIQLDPQALHMKDAYNMTPLMIACTFGHLHVVILLLQFANWEDVLHDVDTFGKDALMCSVHEESTKIQFRIKTRFLGAFFVFPSCIENGNVDIARCVLESLPPCHRATAATRALMCAAFHRNVDTVSLLLSYGADMDQELNHENRCIAIILRSIGPEYHVPNVANFMMYQLNRMTLERSYSCTILSHIRWRYARALLMALYGSRIWVLRSSIIYGSQDTRSNEVQIALRQALSSLDIVRHILTFLWDI